MSILFEASRLKGLKVQNRFVRSATWERMADENGFATRELTDLMVGLAEGNVGLIITGHSYVLPEGQAHPHQLAIYSDDYIPMLSKMTDEVHKAGGRIALQIAHAGFRADTTLTQTTSYGPSVIKDDGVAICAEMDADHISNVISSFGKAAQRAVEAGFDAVEVHGGHGYLVSQFLAPLFNNRKDEFGGNIINRSRILVAILREIKSKVGENAPVLLKLNSEDFFVGGFTGDEMLRVVSILEEQKVVDAIELSGGNSYRGIAKYSPVRTGPIKNIKDEAWYEEAAKQYKKLCSIPLILVGGIRSFETAERLVTSGITDYVAMARPFICEPRLVKRWEIGDIARSKCKSDTLCFSNILDGGLFHCVTYEKANH